MSASSSRTLAYGRFTARALMGFAAAVLVTSAWAQSTDIAKSPLFTSQAAAIKPNLLFVLDDSGSMGWDYMPDEVRNDLASGSYGQYTYQCNGVAYDPAYVYTPPVYADGTSYPNASFTAAWNNGFSTGSGTTNLNGRYYYRYSGTQPKMGWTFTTTAAIKTTTFFKECNSVVGSTPGSAVFTRVDMSDTSADAQNYANWYSYYHTRVLMMKTAVGVAFKNMDDKFRIGFTTIHRALPLLDVSDFTVAQKTTFYSDLYAATPGNSTPLRGALSRAGQYYAKKAPSQAYDPVQYSCQRNFTLLSTDGYWNTGNETSSFGPYKLDNATLVGQQDGAGTIRPYFDGQSNTVTNVYKWNRVDSTPTTTVTPRDVTSTSTPSYTTSTPKSKNTRNSNTSAGNTATTSLLTVSTITQPPSGGTFTITVQTSTNHGYVIGQRVYFTGLPSGYSSGPFTLLTASSKSMTFTATFSAKPTAYSSGAKVQQIATGLCPAGRAYVISQPQTQDVYGNVKTSTTTTSIDSYIDTKVVTNYSTTNFTETVKLFNGAIISDTTTSTTTANSPAATTVTSTTGPSNSTTTAAPVNSTLADSTTAWTNVGAATTGSTCVATSTLPSTTSTGTGLTPPSSTTAIVIINATATTGPTTTTGTVTTTVGATTQGTPSAKTLFSTTSNTSGGSSNSLADVAMYYYNTDLRDASLGNCTGSAGVDVCSNNVNASGDDNVGWQHMATFTLGLGAGSSLSYSFTYPTDKSGDYYAILQGTKDWPVAAADTPTAIDDLWHAAVNGRGRFFSVQNATDLAKSLSAALDSIRAITGTASAAATSTLQPVQGDNDIFVAQFTTVSWIGDIVKSTIDPSSGVITSVAGWSVQAALESKAPSARNIYYKSKTAGVTVPQPFTTANLTADGSIGNFSNFCGKTGASGAGNPTQCATLAAADLSAANTADNLVNFIRGDKTATYYRARSKVLGDIVNASPVYVGKPRNAFTDSGYAAFKTANSTRPGVVYAAANDGMLHAFLQSTGEELWAYIPTPMFSKLYKLADENYTTYHDFFVDGTPSTADVQFTDGTWHTMLVGGYKAGGTGYYALDITNPSAPQVLWEIDATTNVNMGLSYGEPILTKRTDGTWVVALTSGYNNHTGGGDGNGHLFVVNAQTGALLVDLPTYITGTTPAGTTTTPSGLAMINGWVDFDTNNLTKRYYGTDLLGNVWRFDIDSLVAPFNSSMLLAQLRDALGNPQAVTTPPVLAEVAYNGTNYAVVYVATGRYLGTSDLSTTAQQSSYAFIDQLTTTGYGDIRAAGVLVPKTAGTASTVDWQAKRGWLYDFPLGGERANVNSSIALNTIYTATNLPSTDICTIGGTSYEYEFDLVTGNVIRTAMGASLIVGMTVVQLSSDGANPGATMVIITRSSGALEGKNTSSGTTQVLLRRTSWRELY